jgi:hypothetical protein
MRAPFFGAEASTKKTCDDLIASVYGYDLDIRNASTAAELLSVIAERSMRSCIRLCPRSMNPASVLASMNRANT